MEIICWKPSVGFSIYHVPGSLEFVNFSRQYLLGIRWCGSFDVICPDWRNRTDRRTDILVALYNVLIHFALACFYFAHTDIICVAQYALECPPKYYCLDISRRKPESIFLSHSVFNFCIPGTFSFTRLVYHLWINTEIVNLKGCTYLLYGIPFLKVEGNRFVGPSAFSKYLITYLVTF